MGVRVDDEKIIILAIVRSVAKKEEEGSSGIDHEATGQKPGGNPDQKPKSAGFV